jgi:hypothetical protein
MKSKSIDEINVVEILDRVLDNGIVLDPASRVYLMSHELGATKSRMIVESICTHL